LAKLIDLRKYRAFISRPQTFVIDTNAHHR
jgi:hypothetical protein